MDKWFQSKWFVRGLSLFFAIMLYVFAVMEDQGASPNNEDKIFFPFPGSSTQTETVEDVPVEIRIDSEKYVVSGVPEYVNVTLEGTSSSALNLAVRQREFEVFVDLQDLGKGEHTVELHYGNISSELEVTIEPKTIDVIIEERATKEFNVNVDFINDDQLPEGYELGEVEVNPGTVTITSSKSVIEQIGVVKVYVNVAGLTESIEELEVPINVYDSQGNELRVRIEPETVNVSVEIDNPSKSVPVSVATSGTLPEGLSLITIEPSVEEIEVFATSDVLATIEEVTTNEIDLSEITESSTVDIGLDLPEGVHIPNVEQIEVQIEIEQTRTLEAVTIDIDNLAEGQAVSFIEPENQQMSITIVGNEQDVNNLSAEDFRIAIDVEGLDEGEHRVPVTIEGPENISIESEFEEVVIEIT
ncbi:YbbR-like domain-containing protein [Ornithinibacillus salinisoli]|uniref:YbbR-like domain-containing protein n=1 Tax=Ornithinibacillus salinisoli TaxID=1848459 RepID=A0ABW4VX87_9BACI